jgi:hypothetical protein
LVKPRVVAREGKPVVRPTFQLTLAFDRRVMVGAAAAKVFGRLVAILENAQSELCVPTDASPRVSVAPMSTVASSEKTISAEEKNVPVF